MSPYYIFCIETFQIVLVNQIGFNLKLMICR